MTDYLRLAPDLVGVVVPAGSSVAVELWTAPVVERPGEPLLDADGKPKIDDEDHPVLGPGRTVELTPADCFHADVAADFVPAGSGKVGMVTADGGKTWAEPPAPPAPVRTVTTYRLMSVLTDPQRLAYPNVKPWDLRLFQARDTPWPQDNPKIARIASVIGTTPTAWFDAALPPAAA